MGNERGEGLAGLVAKWRERANKCPWCRLNWDLGAHGCHFEPVPPGEQADEYGGVSENCKAFTLRTCIRELETEIAALEAAAPAGTAPQCDKQTHMYVWTVSPRWVAVAQAKTVADAREALLEEIGSSGDGSCPEREAADKFVRGHSPNIWHARNAEFALTDSAELREQEAYVETLQKKIAALATPSPQAPDNQEGAGWQDVGEHDARDMWAPSARDRAAMKEKFNVSLPDAEPKGPATSDRISPAATQEPARSLYVGRAERMTDDLDEKIAEAGQQQIVDSVSEWLRQEITSALNDAAGSPRKVGEDGARMLASEHLRPQNMRFRIARAMAPVLPDEELRLEAANLAALSVNAALLEAARPSSVPVGEQKQEDGV